MSRLESAPRLIRANSLLAYITVLSGSEINTLLRKGMFPSPTKASNWGEGYFWRREDLLYWEENALRFELSKPPYKHSDFRLPTSKQRRAEDDKERKERKRKFREAQGSEKNLETEGLVYLISAEDVFKLKIGYTRKDPKARLASLQTGSPCDLEILAVLKGSELLESELHFKFAKWRLRGEWFNDVPEIREAFGL